MSNGYKRKPNNYFEQNIRRFGPDFLQKKNSRDLQFDAIRMFRDLVRGRIDVRDYEKYFLDSQFIESCIFSANQKYSLHFISFTGVNMLVQSLQMNQQPVDDITMAVLDFHQKAYSVYSLILQGLNSIKMTGTVEQLIPIVGQLRSYRDYI